MFHNLGGGYIIIGVAENQGEPVFPPAGLAANTLDAIQKEILELGHRIVPAYHPVVAPCIASWESTSSCFGVPAGLEKKRQSPVRWRKPTANMPSTSGMKFILVKASHEEGAST